MGLLDDELKSIKSQCIRKPEWATCRYCKLPFKTSCFENSCQRCKHFDLYLVELNAKINFYDKYMFTNNFYSFSVC